MQWSPGKPLILEFLSMPLWPAPVNATPHNAQDSKDSQPTPWRQKPQDNPRGPVSMPYWVRAKFHLWWGFHGWDLVRHDPQMLDQIGIWGTWRPGPCLELFVPVVSPSGSAFAMYHCNSAIVFGWVVHVKVASAWIPGPMFSSRTLNLDDESYSLHLSAVQMMRLTGVYLMSNLCYSSVTGNTLE